MNYFGSFGSSEQEALRLLMPTIDKAIESHENGDYESYQSIITPALSEKLSRDGFKQAHQEIAPILGKISSKVFLGSLQRGNNPMLLFAAKYTNTSDDILINITFENGTSPPKIDWLWIE